MTAILSVGGTPITMIEDSFDLTNATDERQRLKVDAIDYTGTLHFQKGAQVVLTDPLLGGVYTGNLNTDKEVPVYPTGAILHSIDCIDPHYYADKRTVTSTIATPMPAGVHVVKQWNDVLKAEGINANAAFRQDTTQTDFAQGVLSGTISTLNVGDGNLELAQAGSNVTITENTTATFASGTLTNMVVANNTLSPSTVSGLSVSVNLPVSVTGAFILIEFWSGSFTVGVSDTLNYDIWIASSPEAKCSIDLLFSDGTYLSASLLYDQNNVSIAPATDLSTVAVGQWYTRNITLTGLNGKTINQVLLRFAGTGQGTYSTYIKNAYLGSQSGSPFFGTSATATNVSPVVVPVGYIGYVPPSVAATVLPVFNPATCVRTSTAYSISAVALLRSSTVIWNALLPTGAGFSLQASYDGGTSWATCTNNAALPALPAGSNVSGLSVTLREQFSAGTTPSAIPSLTSVAITLVSAPNATKSDILTSYATQSALNTGTFTYGVTSTASGGITDVSTYTRNWNDLLITNQTFFRLFGTASQSASTGAYAITLGSETLPSGFSRLDFLGAMTDFTLDVDLECSAAGMSVGVMYRQTYWDPTATNNTFAYYVGIRTNTSNIIEFGKGSNSSSGSYTIIQQATQTFNTNTFYHLTIVVSGTTHTVYLNHAASPILSATDATYTAPGQIGFRVFGQSAVGTWDNLTVSGLIPIGGTWQSTSASISSLGTCGLSAISWLETNTNASKGVLATVQTSIDGGSTFQNCTNGGGIPNLPSGTAVTGKSIITQVILTAQPQQLAPIVSSLYWRVLGKYPGSSGTRSTAPLVIDTLTRGNVSGSWGTSNDGQTITQVGTGTTNLTSNEGTIANTTGDCRMVYGARTADSEDVTVRFQISANTMSAGAELRYVDANNLYRLSATQNSLSIIMRIGGSNTTLVTATPTIALNTWYRMRFRATSLTPPGSLFGKVWADGTLESSAWTCSI